MIPTFNISVFDQFPIIKTKRLLLREIQLGDASAIFDMRSNPRVNKFIARNNMNDLQDAIGLVERTNAAYRNKQAIGWAGLMRENMEIIGTCGFNAIDIPNLRAEIGGELNVEYWGQNVAIEAVNAIVRFGLETMNLHSIEAKVDAGNRGAIFLLEKLGFKKEAHFVDRILFNNRFQDLCVYTLIKGNECWLD